MNKSVVDLKKYLTSFPVELAKKTVLVENLRKFRNQPSFYTEEQREVVGNKLVRLKILTGIEEIKANSSFDLLLEDQIQGKSGTVRIMKEATFSWNYRMMLFSPSLISKNVVYSLFSQWDLFASLPGKIQNFRKSALMAYFFFRRRDQSFVFKKSLDLEVKNCLESLNCQVNEANKEDGLYFLFLLEIGLELGGKLGDHCIDVAIAFFREFEAEELEQIMFMTLCLHSKILRKYNLSLIFGQFLGKSFIHFETEKQLILAFLGLISIDYSKITLSIEKTSDSNGKISLNTCFPFLWEELERRRGEREDYSHLSKFHSESKIYLNKA